MNDLFVSPDWLRDHLGSPMVKVVDGSWYLPTQGRDARGEFRAGHIPGAVFFDIDAVSDRSTDLPHMLPTPEAFAEAAGALGLTDQDTIVVYDGVGLFSAPRVWWTLRTFGARDVRILAGGLPAWVGAGLPLESGDPHPEPARFCATGSARAVCDMAEVTAMLRSRDASLVDARAPARFRGEAPEPRPGIPSGHMPGARNLPFDALIGPGGKLLDPDALRAEFRKAGVDLDRPVVASCGSGVTAAVLVLALKSLGKEDVALYDGSWAEWASHPANPIATGPA
jgi:thiosulfate/3-mercaptopyruvate sulfurtransferase